MLYLLHDIFTHNIITHNIIFCYNIMKWLFWAFFASVLWAIQSVTAYYFTNKLGINSASLNTFTQGAGVMFMICYMLFYSETLKIRNNIVTIFSKSPLFMILVGIFMLFGNIFIYMSYAAVPSTVNAGLATGLSNISIILNTFLSYLFFKARISTSASLGIIVCFISLFIAVGYTKEGFNNGNECIEGVCENNGEKHNTNHLWIIYALCSAVFYGLGMFFTIILTKNVKNIDMLSISVMILFIQCIIGLFVYVLFLNNTISNTYQTAEFGLDKYSHDLQAIFTNKSDILYGIINGLCEAGGIFAVVKSYQTVPNGGMSDAISGSYSIIQAPLLYYIYNTPLPPNTMVGLIGQIIGVFLIQK